MFLFKNAAIVDGTGPEPQSGMNVLVEGGRIIEISGGQLNVQNATVIDLRGKALMPGLIDCHVHVIANQVDLGRNALQPDSLVALRSIGIMRGMLSRGFTTVRDVGGADFGLAQAVEEGLVEGPRLVISGKALSQTGGHTDFRGRYDERDPGYYTRRLGSMGRLCDGVDEVRRACREELKAGASFIKMMANGGVASPTDPIHFLGFGRDEITAAVEEAANAGTYVAAHLYTDEAIRRAVELGVHSVEHCNLVTLDTAKIMAERGAVACPTLVTYEALKREGAEFGFPAESVAKIDNVRLSGLRSLEILKEAGVTMVFGSDLLGPLHRYQSDEFVIRSQVLMPEEIIRSATKDAARLLRMEGQIGCIEPGAYADLIVVDGNPLSDLSLLAGEGRHIPLIMKAGTMVKNELS
jgi:imidazolonepropionase-like amidohydrolase